MFSIDLSGKTVAITGASQGIGKAIAEVFAGSKASVILLSRNKTKLEENATRLKEIGINARYFVLDVSDFNQVQSVFKEIGHIDILVNNAGIHFTSSVLDMELNSWKELLDINLNGAMYCSKAVIESMTKNSFGRIINISSTSGKHGEAFSSAYNTSKFGLIGFTQCLALELARHNITVNAICPGWVETKMALDILNDDKYASLHQIPKEELEETSLQAVPIGRFVHPKEVGYLALYLASEYASAITGQSINVCGGLCMH